MSTPFLSVFMRVFGLFRVQNSKWFSIDAFSQKGQIRGFLWVEAGLPPDFSGWKPRFFAFSTFFSRCRKCRSFRQFHRWSKTKPIPEGHMLIFGHTPTCYFQNKEPLCICKTDNAIGIDCGAGFEDRRLSCLRLDDMREFYSEPWQSELQVQWHPAKRTL